FIDGGAAGGVAQQHPLRVADVLHIGFCTLCGGVVGALQNQDLIYAEQLRQDVAVDGCGVGGAAGVLDALDDGRVVLQGVVGLSAQGQLVGSAAAFTLHIGLQAVDKGDRVAVV